VVSVPAAGGRVAVPARGENRAPSPDTDKAKQRADLLAFNKYVLDEQAHAIYLLWWQRIVPHRSYVKGWKIDPSHYLNQDLGTVWLDQ
jgi:peptide/nickel transport system substrate-binding protein